MSDWTLLATPADSVLSVAGKTGAVTLTAADVGAAPTVHTHTEAEITGLAGDLAAKASVASVTALSDRVAIVDKGTEWTSGERLFGFTPQNAAGKKLEILQGSTAAPDEGNQPIAIFSRVLKTPESSFSGDGAGNLAALRAHTTAVVGSEGQAIGFVGSAITLSTYEAGHSLADAIGLYGLGVSKGSSTRTGMGLFANGRRETATGRTTGIEVTTDNAVESAAQSFTGTLPGTKAMHIHANGLSNSAAGIVFGYSGQAALHTGIGFVANSITDAGYADYSSSKRSIVVKGSHEQAIVVAAGAGPVVFGAEALSATAGASLVEIIGTETKDPLYTFHVTTGSMRGRLAQTPAGGEVAAFAAGGKEAFLKGTVAGDSGFSYAPGHTFHLGANATPSQLRLTESGVALGMGTTAMSLGEGKGVVFVANAETNPSEDPTSGIIIFSSTGTLTLRTKASASLDAGSKKITGLANGASATDAVAFGQLGSAAFVATSMFDAAGAANAAEAAGVAAASTVATSVTNLGRAYRTMFLTSANANTSAAKETKYFMVSGQTNITAPNPQANAAANFPFLFVVNSSDMAGSGTTKMRLSAVCITQTEPAVTVTVGLYPVTGGATQSLGTVVEGSTIPFESPAALSDTSKSSGDFTPPSNGIYALGYTVSGTPSAAFALQAKAEYHHV
jgi:hypothetical protein